MGTLDMFLDLLRSLHGPKLLRIKGMVKPAETPDAPIVIHGVQHLLHPPLQLERWPDADRRTRLVFITRDLEPAVIEALLRAFLGTPAIGEPDRSALVDNPLVPFGGADR
jgi:G3E family GTPase